MKCFHVVTYVIMWDEMFSIHSICYHVGSNVIMLSCYHNSPAAEVTNKTVMCMVLESRDHRLNIELVLQSLFGLLCTAVHIG